MPTMETQPQVDYNTLDTNHPLIVPFSIIGIILNLCFGYFTLKKAEISINMKYMLMNLCASNLFLLAQIMLFGMLVDYEKLAASDVKDLRCSENTGTQDIIIDDTCEKNKSLDIKEDNATVVHGNSMLFLGKPLSWECIFVRLVESTFIYATFLSVLSITVERFLAVRSRPAAALRTSFIIPHVV